MMTTNKNDKLVAILAEGNTEQAILDVLLQHHALKYRQGNLLQEEILRYRSGKTFARNCLNKSFGQKVKIYRVLDSRNEKFKLPLVYKKKVSNVENLYTRPEIEILFILFHDDYQKFKNKKFKGKKVKPSIFAKENYDDLKNIKSYKENYEFWDNHFDKLIDVLKRYKHISPNNEGCLADLLA